LTALDSLIGTGTNNTLNITTAGTPTTFNGASITGFQVVNLRATAATGNIDLSAAGISGLTNFNANFTGAVQVSNLNTGAAYGLTGNGVNVLGAQQVGYVAAATAGTINVTGGVGPSGTVAPAITLTGNGITSATINSTGAANTVGAVSLAAAGTTTTVNINATTALTTGAITAAAATTYTLTGAGAINISAAVLAATVTTVNAAATSGGVTVALGSAVTQKFTGGSGNDVVTTGALVLTTGTVDGGAGTVDVLDIGANVGNVNTSTLAAKYTNFEALRVVGTLDVSLLSGINAIQLSAGASVLTGLTATQAAAVQARGDLTTTTLALATATGTSDVLTMTLGLGTTTAAAVNTGIITATGFETINLIANPGATAVTADRTSTITGAIVDANLSAVNLSGTAFSLSSLASTKAVTWTATTLTGNGASTPLGLTVLATGAQFAGSVVNGSAFRDTITMDSTTGATFNLAGGNDIFTTTTALLLPSGAATDNTVNGGEGTTDQLVFTGAATATDTTFTKVTGFESLQLAGAGVSNTVTGLGAGFLSAFAGGVTVTDTAAQNAANTYTWASGLYSQNVTLTHATAATLGAVDSNQSITTGGGNDNITLTATAVVGAAGAAGNILINTGAGNDTITVNLGIGQILAVTGTNVATINGGAGQDTISINATRLNSLAVDLGTTSFTMAAGQSTVSASDSITGFLVSAGTRISDTLDFGTANLQTLAATAATGFSAAELTVAVSAVGAVTFAGTSAAGLTLAQQVAAVQSVVVTAVGNTAYWANSGNTYVFNNDTAGDSLVTLVGVTGATALVTTNQLAANAIHIA
jgi:hypothetical protein